MKTCNRCIHIKVCSIYENSKDVAENCGHYQESRENNKTLTEGVKAFND